MPQNTNQDANTAASDDSFVALLKPVFRRRRWFEAMAVLAGASALISYLSDGQGPFWLSLLLIPSVAALIYLFVKLGKIQDYIEQKVWQRFTSVYAIQVLPESSEAPTGIMSKVGVKRRFSPVVTGICGAYNIRVVNADVEYTVETRKRDATRREYTFLEIKTNQTFSNVFLDSKQNNKALKRDSMTILSDSIAHNRTIEVEGDVNKYFTIYAPDDAYSNTLVTLTPDKLLALRDYGKRFDIEFVGSNIYIITDRRIKSPEDILAYQASIIGLLSEIGAELKRDYNFEENSLEVKVPNVVDMLRNVRF